MAKERKMKLIDVDALKKEINFLQIITEIDDSWSNGYVTGLLSIKDVVKTMPTIDAVEVVRCKDCKYWDDEDRCKLAWTMPDEYCSRGERKKP
jgi:hypothetical protein